MRKPASVSATGIKSREQWAGKPNVTTSSTDLKELPIYESASESKTESVTADLNDVSEE